MDPHFGNLLHDKMTTKHVAIHRLGGPWAHRYRRSEYGNAFLGLSERLWMMQWPFSMKQNVHTKNVGHRSQILVVFDQSLPTPALWALDTAQESTQECEHHSRRWYKRGRFFICRQTLIHTACYLRFPMYSPSGASQASASTELPRVSLSSSHSFSLHFFPFFPYLPVCSFFVLLTSFPGIPGQCQSRAADEC